MLKSMFLSSARPFHAAPGGSPPAAAGAANQGDDQGDNDGAADQGAADDDAADQGGDTGAADQGAAGGEGDDDQGGEQQRQPPAAAAQDWRDKEIGRKHRQLQATKQALAERDQELETMRALVERGGGAAADPVADPAADPAARRAPVRTAAEPVSEELIQREVDKRVAADDFNKAANAANAAGVTRYKDDWNKATDTLKTLGGFDPETMLGILATDDPAQVLYRLGSKPEEYQRIMELPPYKRQSELVKLGLPEPKAPVKQPSNAPAPVDGLRSRARGDSTQLRDELPDDEWYARRKAQKDARWAAKQAAARGAPAE